MVVSGPQQRAAAAAAAARAAVAGVDPCGAAVCLQS